MVSPSGLIYIGSTCQSLAIRKAGHKRNYKSWKIGKRTFTTSFKLFEDDKDNVDIVLIENVNCNNKEELHKRERFYIETINCVNKIIVGRTSKEWREDNKDIITKNKKIPHECECGSIFRKDDKVQHERTIKHQNFIKSQIIQQ
jgi:hypothetical protein